MEEIKKYSDTGTKERHRKHGGVRVTNVEGQLNCKGIESYLDGFLEYRIFTQEQHNSTYQLVRDYQVGCLYKWKIVRDYLNKAGASECDINRIQEEARKNFDAAIRYNGEFIKLANLAHLLLEHTGVAIPPAWKMQQLADRLTKFYRNHDRITLKDTEIL